MNYHLLLALLLTILLPPCAQAQKKAKQKKGKPDCSITVPATLIWASEDGVMIQSNCNLLSMSFKIYNRWGQIIYKADTAMKVEPPYYLLDNNKKENISNENEFEIKTGVHVWEASFSVRGEKALEEKWAKGNITLIR